MRPRVVISLGGKALAEPLKRVLSGSIVETDGDKADQLRLVISNHDGRLAKPRRGEVISIEVGWEETGVVKGGQFTITETVKVGAGAQFEVVGDAADLKKTLKRQKTRSWTKGKSLGDVMEQLASDNGLTLAMSAELRAIKIETTIAQTNESDMHLATRLGRTYGALVKVAEGRLLFVKRGAGRTASGAAAQSMTITPADLEDDFKITDRDRPRRSKIKAQHYDRATAKRKTIESEANSDAGDADAPDYTLPQTFGSEEEAKKAVEAKRKELKRRGKSFSGTYRQGLIGPGAGGVLTTEHFGDDDDQDWSVKKRTIDFDASGVSIKFEGEPKVG